LAGALYFLIAFMQLVFYVDDKKVDSITVTSSYINISRLMDDMRNKHAELLKQSKEHKFMLEHVPSAINDFRSLKDEVKQ
jgi:hypothetical protein